MGPLRVVCVGDEPAAAGWRDPDRRPPDSTIVVRAVANAAELTAALQDAPCDLVISSLDPATADGQAVAAAVRSHAPDVPFWAVAAEGPAEADRCFTARLEALLEVTTALQALETVDDVCRAAVELGCSRLGFDRLGIWFIEGDQMCGSFGTDEAGQLRDERAVRRGIGSGNPWLRLRDGRQRSLLLGDAVLSDHDRHGVGRGTSLVAAMRARDHLIGFVAADNLLSARPLTDYDRRLAELLASSLAELVLRSRAELAERAMAEADRLFAERLAELHRVAGLLEAVETVDELARSAVELARTRLGFERLSLWLHQGDGQYAGTWGTDEEGRSRDERSSRAPLRSAAALAATGSRSVLQPDVELRDANGLVVRRGSHLSVALWSGEQVIGEFMADTLLTGRAFTAADQRLLELFAGRLAQMLGRVRDLEDDRWFATQLEALYQVTNLLHTVETVDELSRMAVELGRARLGFERLGLWLHDRDNVYVGTYGTDEQGQTRDERACRRVFERLPEMLQRGVRSTMRQGIALLDVDGQEVGHGTHLSAQLWAGDSIVGQFDADNLLRGEPLTAGHQRLLELYAGRLAQLLGRVRALEADRAFAAKLEALYRVTNLLYTAETVDELTRLAVELGRSQLGFERLSLWLHEGDGHYVGTFGTDEHGETCDERVVHQQFTRVPAGRSEDIRSALVHDEVLRRSDGQAIGRGSLLCTLLWAGDRVVGQFMADNLLHGSPLTADHRRLLELYAGRLTQMLGRVRTLEADRRFAASLESLHALVNELQGQPTFDDLCRAAVGLGRERLGLDRLSIWLHLGEGTCGGTYGTDEQGQTRDERGQRARPVIDALLASHARSQLDSHAVLRDDAGRDVGQGMSLSAAMWNGDAFVGLVTADNLLRRRPLDDSHCRLLELYAASLAQLFQRRRAEDALGASEETYRALFESSRDAIFISDLQGYLACNQATVAMFGCASREQFLATARAAVSPPLQPDGSPSLERAQQLVAAALGGELQLFEWVHQRADGTPFPAEVQLTPMPLGDRTVLQVVVRDLTERKRAEETRNRLMAAIEAAAEVVVITGPDGTIRYVNAAFERVTGYDREAVNGQSINVLKSGVHDAAYYRQMWDTITRGGVWQGQLTNRRRDGSRYIARVTITPVRDASGTIIEFVAIQEDVTEELELQAKLTRAQTLQVVGQLAGGIGHDFNNLLQVIVMCVEMAADTLPALHPVHEDLDQVRSVVAGGAELVKKLLLFSRETGTDDEHLDLNAVVGDVAVLLRRTLGEDLELRLDLAPTLPPVRSSKVGMQQVLLNLAVNARHAMDDGGMLRVATSEEYLAATDGRPGGPMVHLSVTDTGCGMGPEVLAHVFEPYFTTRREGGGTGLGLATVYAVVDKAGGRINVNSHPGVGTTFDLYFPVASAAAEPATVRRVVLVPDGQGETILVVEDEDALRRWLCMVLERHGYRVLQAANGSEALVLAQTHADEIALLLTDVIMPGMSGPHLAEQLLTTLPDLPVLFMSGYAEARHYGHGFQPSDANLLGKPFDAETVLGRLRTALTARPAAPR